MGASDTKSQPLASASSEPRRILIPDFLICRKVRVFFLRTILITASLSLAWNTWTDYTLGIVINSLTIGHYLLSALGPGLFSLLLPIDMIFMVAESVYYIRELVLHGRIQDLRSSPKLWVLGIFGYYVTTMSILALLIVKILCVVASKGRALLERVNIAGEQIESPPEPPKPVGGQEDTSEARNGRVARLFEDGWWQYPLHTLSGESAWKRRLPGEAHWLIILRGTMAFLAIASIIVYAVFAIILQPLAELGLTPSVQLVAGSALPSSFKSVDDPVVWNLYLVMPIRSKRLIDMVTVEPLWAPDPTSGEPLPGPPCNPIDLTPDVEAVGSGKDVVLFNCPPRKPILAGNRKHLFPGDPADIWPPLLLTANFSGLSNISAPYGINDAVQAYLGCTNKTQHIVSTTRAIPLFPGTNTVALAGMKIRQKLHPAALGTLGFFNLYDTFLFAHVTYTGIDPFSVPNPDVGTLRIGWEGTTAEWTVIQDYRTKSILDGISALGGLGSAFGVAFAVSFGASLMQLVYRTKHATPFGIFHRLGDQKELVAERSAQKYPYLSSDLKDLKEKPGLNAFLYNTLIDIELLKAHTPNVAPPTEGERTIEDYSDSVRKPQFDARSSSASSSGFQGLDRLSKSEV